MRCPDVHTGSPQCASADFNPNGTASKIAQRISGLELQPMTSASAFVKPESVLFEMNGELPSTGAALPSEVLTPTLQGGRSAG